MTIKVRNYKESEKLSQARGYWGDMMKCKDGALDWILMQREDIDGKT